MEKKKLGLSGKSKLELSKTVGSGTVKQSFSHGRVKSVAVEVKKIRTFRKNNEGSKPVNEDSLDDKQSDNIVISEKKIEENNHFISIPECWKNRTSSVAIKASIRFWGNSLNVALERFSL